MSDCRDGGEKLAEEGTDCGKCSGNSVGSGQGLLTQLKEGAKAGIRDIFDRNGDGKIDREDINVMIEKLSCPKRSPVPAEKDLLRKRLNSLEEADIISLLTSGLGIEAVKIAGQKKEELVNFCSKELRTAAGSTLRNWGRGEHDFPYKQLLIDVADKLTAGSTLLSWTHYKLKDEHTEKEIEDEIIHLFNVRAQTWWKGLDDKKKSDFVNGIDTVLRGDKAMGTNIKDGVTPFIMQQAIENMIQSGIMFGLSKVAAPTIIGALGVSVVSHVGWLILLQTVGWMGGLKIAVLGIGGMGAFGGAVGFLGATAITGALGLPTAILALDGPAYRKTVPTVVMLLAKTRMGSVKRGQTESADGPASASGFDVTERSI